MIRLITTRGSLRHLGSENGSSMIEIAIILPILLILFAGAAELGRLFYTYTTLAKATKVGARYTSTSKEATSSDATIKGDAIKSAQSLVVCGVPYTIISGAKNYDCTGLTPIVSGLSPTANVDVQVSAPDPNGIRYVTVAIKSFNYQRGTFNLESMIGTPGAFYKAFSPATKMRYMP